MTVPTQTSSVVYAGTGAVSIYAYTWQIVQDADLQVWTKVVATGVITQLALTTDYTVQGAGVFAGGTVTLVAGSLPSGTSLFIASDPSEVQLTLFAQNAPTDPAAVMAALDLLTREVQAVRRLANNAIQLPVVESLSGFVTSLVAASQRALMFLGFDLTGAPTVLANSATGVPGTLVTQTVDTIAALKAVTAPLLAPTILVRGYHTVGDAGGGIFWWNAADTSADNGGTIIALNAGGTGRWNRNYDSRFISVRDFGAYGDNSHDDTAAIQAAVSYVEHTYDPATYGSNSPYNGPCALFFPAGYYKVTDLITVTQKIAVEGEGQTEFSSGSRICQFTSNKDIFQIVPIAQGMSCSFEKMTLLSNTSGTGDLINITKAAGLCNSLRIRDCTFGTPQRHSINIQAGDDPMITGCLFDVSAGNAIALGTTDSAHVASNCLVSGCAFFSIATRCFLLYNVDGLQISDCTVYGAASFTPYFVDGYNSLPYQLKNITLCNNIFKAVECGAKLTAVVGFNAVGNEGSACGGGAGSTLNFFEFTGSNTNVLIQSNNISGNWDTKSVYTDVGASVTGCISDNHFIATGGTGRALTCANLVGEVRNNNLIGWTLTSVSQNIATTGSAINTGLIAGGAAYTATFTVTGAQLNDRVQFGMVGAAWVPNIGIEVVAWISAADTVSVSYRNVTAGNLTPAAHDITYEVVR